MKEIKVRDIYKVDTISRTNNKAWGKLIEIMEEDNVETLFDFKGIEVIDPWCNDKFKKYIGNENVHMKLYSSAKTVDTINMACVLGGFKDGRVTNEDITAPVGITSEERKVNKAAEELQRYFVSHGGTSVLEVYKRYDQLGSIMTVKYINKAIELYNSKNKDIKKFILDTKRMSIQSKVIELIASLMGELYRDGIELNIVSEDKDVMNKLGLFQHLSNKVELTTEDKIKAVKECLPVNMVGMLSKYRRSRALDEFGRQGKGETVSCRVAIYNGLEKNRDGEVCLKITSYNGNKFYTQEHWALENDNEILKGLDRQELLIPIDEIGILNNYLGSRYHFMSPIQYEKEDNSTIYNVNENGGTQRTSATIPMRIKIVLDSWGVEYDESSLINAISETERILAN